MCQRIKTGSIKLDGSTVFIDTGMNGCQHTGTFINDSDFDLIINTDYQYVIPARMCLVIPIKGPINVGPKDYIPQGAKSYITGQLIWQVTDGFAVPSLTSIYADTHKEQAVTLSIGGGPTFTNVYIGNGDYKKLVFILGDN